METRRAAVIVVDTNLICYRWMSSPNSLWRSEFRKIVALAIRKKAITIHAAQEIMRKAEASFERRELPFRLMRLAIGGKV